MDAALEVFFSRPALKALLSRLSAIEDPREPWRVIYPLREVLFLAIRGTMCGGASYDEIAAWNACFLAGILGAPPR